MSLKTLSIAILYLLVTTSCNETNNQKPKEKLPNIVIIYADDMGYGDLGIQNKDSKISTPNLDQLAREGMRFTDAHSSSAICSPSRFALLTGSYHWRRQHGIVQSFGKPFFKDSDYTLPQALKTKDYTTACIGKWHLGWDWEFNNEPTKIKRGTRFIDLYAVEDVDWEKPIAGGPLARGFDYYFGDGTINFPPYAWVENDRIIEAPTEAMKDPEVLPKEGVWGFRPGPKAKEWNPFEVLPKLTKKTIEWIGNQDKKKPFFLYLSLPSPHEPIVPNDEFDGKSKAGAYGDYMVQTDWVAGEVLKAIKSNGFEENTIIIFTSDNGPENTAWKRAEEYGHFSMGDFRGLKRDVWEGGHHVPFIVKWPGKVKKGTVSNEVICQTDIMATLMNITEVDMPENAAPDSYNFTPVLEGKTYKNEPLREATVHNTLKSRWALRKGNWLYINNKTGSQVPMPVSFKKLGGYSDFDTEELLFNMKDDQEQRVNLYNEHPEKVKEMKDLLEEYRTGKQTRKAPL
ncbi:sulfatase family protein [Joostella sp.]|uniref:sulfatase family protein n=1 Tax=Joostella sp. TaxID=2231138 RepID=UPI003A8FE085